MLWAALLLATGCAFHSEGRTRHFILGFGIVTVTDTNSHVATIVKTQALGLSASEHGVAVGLSSSLTTFINTNQNVLIEVSPQRITIP